VLLLLLLLLLLVPLLPASLLFPLLLLLLLRGGASVARTPHAETGGARARSFSRYSTALACDEEGCVRFARHSKTYASTGDLRVRSFSRYSSVLACNEQDWHVQFVKHTPCNY